MNLMCAHPLSGMNIHYDSASNNRGQGSQVLSDYIVGQQPVSCRVTLYVTMCNLFFLREYHWNVQQPALELITWWKERKTR